MSKGHSSGCSVKKEIRKGILVNNAMQWHPRGIREPVL